MLAAGLLSLAGGIMVGVILYYGLLRIPVYRLFTVTGWMVLLLAAGLAAQAAGFLVQADLLPALVDQVWNTSFLLSEEEFGGQNASHARRIRRPPGRRPEHRLHLRAGRNWPADACSGPRPYAAARKFWSPRSAD